MARRLLFALLVSLAAAGAATAQAPSESKTSSELEASIAQLGVFEFDVRNVAARRIRRAPASQATVALTAAVRAHADQFVRFRSLVLLTAFNDPATPELMRSVLRDRNDRIREVAYRWFALYPEPALAPTLLELLQTEQAEFVRPALVMALAALGSDPQVQRALISEAGRGLDFFRIAVIEALGQQRATFAADTIAEVAKIEGPLQDDAVLALARIGDARARTVVAPAGASGAAVAMALLAAPCLIGGDCAAAAKSLADAALNREAAAPAVQAAVTALAAVAGKPDMAATNALVTVVNNGSPAARDRASVELSVLAIRNPQHALAWLESLASGADREDALELLRRGFDRMEEDFAEEQFYATARAHYWAAAEGSSVRARVAALIDALTF